MEQSGMRLRDYPINKEIADILEVYARENSLNTSSLIEELISKFLYEKECLVEDETITQTPEDIFNERKNKFRTINKGRYYHLYFLELDFGVFKKNELDSVKNKLLNFSDEELFEMSRDNWKFSDGKYKRFIRQKLDNPLLTAQEFIKYNKLNEHDRKDSITLDFEGEMLVSFNKKKYSKETIENAKVFLNQLPDDKLFELSKNRKDSNLSSAEFILEYMSESKKLPYVYDNNHGGQYIYRKGTNFGTYSSENITDVWHFLENSDWDTKYSSKETGLRGKKHSEWVCSEMKKEQSVSMEGK